jgi:hypothetical protein
MAKFAKKESTVGKGHLVVDLGEDIAPDLKNALKRQPKPKMAVVGTEDSETSSKKILKGFSMKDKGVGKVINEGKKEKDTGKAAKKEKSSKGERSTDTRKIKVLVKGNPKREGSASYARFELYKFAKTVDAFITAGGTAADVAHDSKKGYISVA